MIVGFAQEIPYKWNSILTCAIGAILLLATCSLIGIILLVSLGVFQQQQALHLNHEPSYRQRNMSGSLTGNQSHCYGTPCSGSGTPPSALNLSASFLGLSQQSLEVGLKCAVAFSWVLPTLYCIAIWLIRHVMHTRSATWWLKFATLECNLLIVNQTLLGIIFYLICGVLIKRLLLLLPSSATVIESKCGFLAEAVTSPTQRYVNHQTISPPKRFQ